MKQSSKRLFSLILSIVLLATSFVVFFDLIQPTYADLAVEKGTEVSTQNLLTTEQQIVNQAKALVGQYESDAQTENSLALAMPSGPNLSSALAQVYGIAQNNGIGIQTINFSSPTVSLQNQGSAGGSGAQAPSTSQIIKPLGTFTIQITAVGSYENMKNFLSQLETNIRIFDLTTMSFQSSAPVVTGAKGATAASDFFVYNFTITTYYQLP